MKGFSNLVLLVILLMTGRIAVCQETTVNPHKFSTETWSYNERCNPCHVENPENKSDTKNDYLISYESDTLSAADSSYLSGVSKLCYACHDGTIAGFSHVVGFDEGIDLDGEAHNHPVSIVYRADSLNRNRLFNPETKMSGLGGTIAEDMLINGRVECTSCHDAHFSMTKTSCKSCPPDPQSSISSLWVNNRKSALCLICHDL